VTLPKMANLTTQNFNSVKTKIDALHTTSGMAQADFADRVTLHLRKVSSLRDFAANKLIRWFDKLILDILPLVLYKFP